MSLRQTKRSKTLLSFFFTVGHKAQKQRKKLIYIYHPRWQKKLEEENRVLLKAEKHKTKQHGQLVHQQRPNKNSPNPTILNEAKTTQLTHKETHIYRLMHPNRLIRNLLLNSSILKRLAKQENLQILRLDLSFRSPSFQNHWYFFSLCCFCFFFF